MLSTCRVIGATAGSVEQLFGKPRGAPVELVLYGRQDCHLCDVADAALRRTARRVALTVTYVDIDTDPVLRDRYGARIPVVTASDGRVVAEGKVSETRLRAGLRALQEP